MHILYLCVHARKCSSMHEFSFLASTTSQHGRVFDCQMLRAPGDGTTPPKDSHCKKISLASGAECIVSKWQVSWTVPWGTPPAAPTIGRTPVAPQRTCLSHMSPPPGCPATQHSQELTTPKCYWQFLSVVGMHTLWWPTVASLPGGHTYLNAFPRLFQLLYWNKICLWIVSQPFESVLYRNILTHNYVWPQPCPEQQILIVTIQLAIQGLTI